VDDGNIQPALLPVGLPPPLRQRIEDRRLELADHLVPSLVILPVVLMQPERELVLGF
jgi:hypothetical protein